MLSTKPQMMGFFKRFVLPRLFWWNIRNPEYETGGCDGFSEKSWVIRRASEEPGVVAPRLPRITMRYRDRLFAKPAPAVNGGVL